MKRIKNRKSAKATEKGEVSITGKRAKILTALCVALSFLFGNGDCACAERAVPIAENLELVTEKNTPVEGVLSAHGCEGEKLSFRLTTNPIKGELKLEEDGRFVYTPRENKKGRDYFGYRVSDKAGGVSEEATVLIRITKEKER